MNFQAAISDFIRHSSLGRKLLPDCAIVISPKTPTEFPAFSSFECISRIILIGKALSIRLSYCFDMNTARFLSGKYLSLPADSVQEKQARDFMGEFANIQGGFVKAVLDEAGLKIGLSLPLILAGASQPTTGFTTSNKGFVIPWELHLKFAEGEFKLMCIASVDFIDRPAVEALAESITQKYQARLREEKSGEIEFL